MCGITTKQDTWKNNLMDARLSMHIAASMVGACDQNHPYNLTVSGGYYYCLTKIYLYVFGLYLCRRFFVAMEMSNKKKKKD